MAGANNCTTSVYNIADLRVIETGIFIKDLPVAVQLVAIGIGVGAFVGGNCFYVSLTSFTIFAHCRLVRECSLKN